MYKRIVTHDDFDGVVSAALVGYFTEIHEIMFAGPMDITNSRFSIGESDIVCDLPYPLDCGQWFDHHEANLEEVELRGIDPDTIEGLHLAAPSCARVVLDFFGEEFDIEEEIETLAAAADKIDSFDFKSIEDWRARTPANIIDSAIKYREGSPADRRTFLKKLALLLMDYPLEEIAAREDIAELARRYWDEEENMTRVIMGALDHLDPDKEIILLDFSDRKKPVRIQKNLAQLLDRQALAVLEIKPVFQRGVKVNALALGISMTIRGASEAPERDLGEMMRTLNIGSGHAGAAAGRIDCDSLQALQKESKRIQKELIKLWKSNLENTTLP